ncbi:type II toxin-antitoxin system PemK/MazF family toxin [Paenibacillaceae bacterium]|nr:type II toxin-antitoxin system PemK/MazF family toxin [Paenibacillaceae bacterium]
MRTYKRREVWYADMSGVVGSEQGGLRTVLIVQNDIGNRFSPTTVVACLTTKVKKLMPTHVFLDKDKNKLEHDSYVLAEQLRTIDKDRLIEKKTEISEEDMEKVFDALDISVGRKLN